MAKTGKISVIPKDYSTSFPTMETSLRLKGYSRMPGTGSLIFPAKSVSGRYITGLDEFAPSIMNMMKENPQEAKIKQEEVIKLRIQLQDKLGLDLSPTSDFFNFASKADKKVDGFKLIDGDNLFDLDIDKNPWHVLTYAWVSSHPTIASSMEAYERGEYPADTQFFVNDEDKTSDIVYKKHKLVDDAIIKFSSFTIEHRKKIVRCMGIPITDNVVEAVVYNQFRETIAKPEMNVGPYKGMFPVTVFNKFADLKKDVLEVRDLVERALIGQIYREGKGNKIYEGESVVFDSKKDMIDWYSDDKNQQDLFELQSKVKLKNNE